MRRIKRRLKRVVSWIQARFSEDRPENGGDPRKLQEVIGYRFKNTALLLQSLKHRSHVYAKDESGIHSNERLEFLGDAVLDLLVTEHLYRKFRRKREGKLTQIKSMLVSRAALAWKAREIGLGRYIFLSREEEESGGRNRSSIVSDAYEALLGAVYLDGGLEETRRLVSDQLLKDMNRIILNHDYLNFKSALLEHAQSEGWGHPKYYVNSEEGPDHKKVFTVEVTVRGENLGAGRGRSKKEAQQMAAKEALERLGVG